MGVLDNSNKYSNNNLNTYSTFKHQVDDLCPIESHDKPWALGKNRYVVSSDHYNTIFLCKNWKRVILAIIQVLDVPKHVKQTVSVNN